MFSWVVAACCRGGGGVLDYCVSLGHYIERGADYIQWNMMPTAQSRQPSNIPGLVWECESLHDHKFSAAAAAAAAAAVHATVAAHIYVTVVVFVVAVVFLVVFLVVVVVAAAAAAAVVVRVTNFHIFLFIKYPWRRANTSTSKDRRATDSRNGKWQRVSGEGFLKRPGNYGNLAPHALS